MEKPPYTPNPAIVKKFFKVIQDIGKPPKVHTRYLPTIGFKSSNDRYLVGVLKFLNFTDNSGVPTNIWNEYKNKANAPQIMASAIKSSYDKLFEVYPDAEKRDKTAITDFLRQLLVYLRS